LPELRGLLHGFWRHSIQCEQILEVNMGLIKDSDKEIIRKKLGKMRGEVTLVYFTQEMECDFCRETHELVQEISELSDKLKVEIYDFKQDTEAVRTYGIDKIPAIAVTGERDYGIRYYGIPAGYEFASLLEDVLMVSSGDSALSGETRKMLQRVKEPVHLQVFVTPTWPYCPTAVRLAHQMALESDWIRADMVEVTEFPHLAQKYQVMGVPRTVINEGHALEGAAPESMLARRLLDAVGDKSRT
jgi:glutaredoxin-like protein